MRYMKSRTLCLIKFENVQIHICSHSGRNVPISPSSRGENAAGLRVRADCGRNRWRTGVFFLLHFFLLQRLKSLCHPAVTFYHGRRRGRRKKKEWKEVDLSDPLGVAEDENEQSPEENGDDSRPDQDHDLHVGLVAGASTQREKAEKTINYTVTHPPFQSMIDDGALRQL